MAKRKYLTKYEIEKLLESANKGMNAERNHCMILMAYRHGLRISELLSLTTADIDLHSKRIFIKRLKNGFSVSHPCTEKEIDVLLEWLNIRNKIHEIKCNNIFVNSLGGVISRKQAWFIIRKCGIESGFEFNIHPHMLRHSCGYHLAEIGTDTRLIQDYLGHRNIRHTVTYTASNFKRFSDLWCE